MPKDRLVTPSYVLILAANFLLYFAFYLILPVLPFYLTEIFTLPDRLLPVHHRLCRIHPCRGAVTVHHAPGGAWTGFRNGDRSG